MNSSLSVITFNSPQSSFNPSFWEKLYNKKLSEYKLLTATTPISSSYITSSKSNGTINFTENSFFGHSTGIFPRMKGKLLVVNSLEEFMSFDKKSLIEEMGNTLLSKLTEEISTDLSDDLLEFFLLSFPDLKNYRFYYWFCLPIIAPLGPFQSSTPARLKELMKDPATSSFNQMIDWKVILENLYGFIQSSIQDSEGQLPFAFALHCDTETSQLRVLSLEDSLRTATNEGLLFILLDQSCSDDSLCWSSRNLLAALFLRTSNSNVSLLSLRNQLFSTRSRKELQCLSSFDLISEDASLFLRIQFPREPSDSFSLSSRWKFFGWEVNERGRPGPRVADLSALLDSSLLMNQAVDLNIRLMKWRMWTDLQVERLAEAKCLLLGAGTLGCSVARCLIGWGVRNITFVDNGIVSYSNPVRQSLFEFEDCTMRKFKSLAAAERLQKIFPGIRSKGFVVTIPMPGHPFTVKNASSLGPDGVRHYKDEEAVDILDELILEHDFIFTLTDSREARWLPVLLAAARCKPVINSALGFDSYLVMQQSPNEDKGCYFCNDIVAAGNSKMGRPLDEQCTVTRPGLSLIAGGLCGEIMVSLLHQSRKSDSSGRFAEDNVCAVPHQIRGFLSGFSQIVMEGPRFPLCTACSLPIITQFLERRHEFVREVCDTPTILEEISGIRQMTASIDLDNCIDSDEDF